MLELSNLSAHAGTKLKYTMDEIHLGYTRQELLKLATLMTRYTLQMSSDDCGGLSEYVEFFTCLRQVWLTSKS